MKNIKNAFFFIVYFSLLISFSCNDRDKSNLNKNYSNDEIDFTDIESSLQKLKENNFLYLKIKDSLDENNNKSKILYELLDYEDPMPSKSYFELCITNNKTVKLNNSDYDENCFRDYFLTSFKESLRNNGVFKSHVFISIDASKLKDDLTLRKLLKNILNSSLTNFDSIREKYSFEKYNKSFKLLEFSEKKKIIELVPLSIYLCNNPDCDKPMPPPAPRSVSF
jgi:hypothetical protein